jgi:hypothetical protein
MDFLGKVGDSLAGAIANTVVFFGLFLLDYILLGYVFDVGGDLRKAAAFVTASVCAFIFDKETD